MVGYQISPSVDNDEMPYHHNHFQSFPHFKMTILYITMSIMILGVLLYTAHDYRSIIYISYPENRL